MPATAIDAVATVAAGLFYTQSLLPLWLFNLRVNGRWDGLEYVSLKTRIFDMVPAEFDWVERLLVLDTDIMATRRLRAFLSGVAGGVMEVAWPRSGRCDPRVEVVVPAERPTLQVARWLRGPFALGSPSNAWGDRIATHLNTAVQLQHRRCSARCVSSRPFAGVANRHLRSARHGAPAQSFLIAHALARAASTEQHVAVPARCVDAAARLEWAAAAFGLGSALWAVGVLGAAICVCSAATRRRRITLIFGAA
ncbi:hypothetical protein EMIHUDRAFT_452335 [Emiliania huxleyi CCMP1516]|uniref:GPI-GlcNAc transferase complex PIG-H component conserved domain-containing protein n=2 Tax=Emiliania huxleyi TaxID=2903 RepID=A0A0D3IKU2_EMIH1|nr:hypothetical protein EMIHUDRAFT_452335 [Emiliania huxleyi CCMP1516]EOD11877.1 hypothetical protein EMIHUDRAFT_452335 [Emiliania huxleyi CCMP1516]|eukprot:XP_005764306.1 hypothetical protein EMIHUDRAFT_452335 [Emiliania huxleyi CCMP1516]